MALKICCAEGGGMADHGFRMSPIAPPILDPRFPLAERPRLRVAVTTFGLSPIRGSEAAIAWQHVSRLAKYHDIVALSFPGLRGEIREECAKYFAEKGPVPGLTIEFIEPPPFARALEKNSSSLLRAFISVGNRSWQRAAFERVQVLHAEKPFDAVHQMTITGYREPGFLWKLGVPFFWGPVAGASDVPFRYFPLMGWRDRIAYGARNIANWIQMRIAPRPRKAARAASEIWAVGPDNTDLITGMWGVPSTHIYECAAWPPKPDQAVKTFKPGEKLRLVTAGYLVGRKAIPIVLHSLALVGDKVPWEYTVMGHGPEKERWIALGNKLGLGERVRWIDNLPHAQALAEIQSNHVFAFPSLKEGTSSVVPESFTMGLPVICHDMCGMSLMVNDSCGIKVPPRGPDASARGFADAIIRLATTEGEVERLSRGALVRASQVTWDANAQMMAEAYWQHAMDHPTGKAPASHIPQMRVA
jgi:glycosyltransferase involved in cell wall biosynthesis